MRGSTAQLYEMMESNEKVSDYIYSSWNILFNDIYEYKEEWDKLDEISAFAIQDLYEEGIV